jgi:alkylated DNA repair dioxygenase AlkB
VTSPRTPGEGATLQHSQISGLEYLADYVDRETQDRLLCAVDEHPWQTSVDHRVQIYGYHYSHKQRTAFRIGEIPAWATGVANRLHHDGFVASVPNQLVVNEYQPGNGFFDHIDQSVFGDIVTSISLGSTCVIRFTRSEPDRSTELLLEPGSLLVLSGEARWHWKHGIPARASDRWNDREYARSRRVSLTFRAVPDDSIA